jgi:hypothetical protein
MVTSIPPELCALFWDVDPMCVRIPEHADYVIERIMLRGGWNAMCWLRRTFDDETLADFLRRKGHRLAPRERAYWQLVTDAGGKQEPGGGRPAWAGT